MMLPLFYVAFSLAAVLKLVVSAPAFQNNNNGTSLASLFPNSMRVRDIDDSFDFTDHSDIVRMAAIGDSYSAGIGAGNKLGNLITAFDAWNCSRYDHSYPWLLHNSPALGDPNSRNFQFRSCSGALATEVLNNQIPRVDPNQQVILLSAGGNDIGLTNILNQCVYQWLAFNPTQTLLAKLSNYINGWKWVKNIDVDSAGRGCDPQLDLSESLATSPNFASTLDSLISAATLRLSAGGKVYWTGYAKFWAESYTTQCDKITWTTWIHHTMDFKDNVYLTVARRQRMNKLVDIVNSQIKAAAQRAGPSVIFVDYDPYVGEFGGRFCESGVDESASDSGVRPGLMFYEYNTKDPYGTTPFKRSEDDAALGTFEGDLAGFGELNLILDPDAQFTSGAQISSAKSSSHLVAAVDGSPLDTLRQAIPNPLPDGYGRSFHPQVLLHQLITNLIIYQMTNEKAMDNNLGGIAEEYAVDYTCPYTPPNITPGGGGVGGGGGNGGNGGGGGAAGVGGRAVVPRRGTTNVTFWDLEQIALASYISPQADPKAWERMIAYPPDKLSVLVANIMNGPDRFVDNAWAPVIASAASSGKTVIGYVRTGYLSQNSPPYQTRLGGTNLADWIAQIESDVDAWYTLYPGLSGIFFDEGWNDCGPNNQYSEVYKFINYNTKRKYPGAFTVLNPGAPMPQCFEHSADTLLTFENNYETYMTGYTPNSGWTPSDTRKIWHIIHNVSAENAAAVATKAKERGAGLLHITDDIEPNPYDTLPSVAYMQSIIDVITGGKPLVEPRPVATGKDVYGNGGLLRKVTTDYSSATFTIGVSDANTDTQSLVLNGIEMARLPTWVTTVTIGGLTPGTSQSWRLYSVPISGFWDDMKDWFSVETTTTSALPDNKAINNVKLWASTPTSTTFVADVLVPFAFLRIYLTDPDTRCNFPAWPTNYNAGHYVCAHYMVEGKTLYKYTGALLPDGKTNYPWAWTQTGAWENVEVTTDGYQTTWVLPIGTDDVDPNYFIIQAMGYGPTTNIFVPCPDHWKSGTPADGASCTGNWDYDCQGNKAGCKAMPSSRCTNSANNLNATKLYVSNGITIQDRGSCWEDELSFACTVQIRGVDSSTGLNCMMTGQDMFTASQDIRSHGHCDKCGSKHLGYGCLLSLDYNFGCDDGAGIVNSTDPAPAPIDT